MSQREQIEQHLNAGRRIDPQIALRDYRCFRLAARIKEIARKMKIERRIVRTDDGKAWAEYWKADD